MIGLRFLTFVGIDDSTSVAKLKQISKQHPFVEWAVRLDEDIHDAGSPGYASWQYIEKLSGSIKDKPFAIHFGESESLSLIWQKENSPYFKVASKFNRVKLDISIERLKSINLSPYDVYMFIRRICVGGGLYDTRHVILNSTEDHNQIQLIQEVGREAGPWRAFEHYISSNPPSELAIDRAHGRPFGFSNGEAELSTFKSSMAALLSMTNGRLMWTELSSGIYDDSGKFSFSKVLPFISETNSFIVERAIAEGAHLGSGNVTVDKLSKAMADWWLGYIEGYNMFVPPKDWSRCMYMARFDGSIQSYEVPSGIKLQKQFNIALLPSKNKKDYWEAYVVGDDYAPLFKSVNKNPEMAVKLTAIKSVYGNSVPKNPANILKSEKEME